MMDITKSQSDFEAWWNAPEQAELRSSCAMGWGFRIWKSARESISVELPELPVLGSNADWYQGFAEAAKCMRSACSKSIRAAGIRIKGD
ncbi:hypothetical protein V1956_20230 [Yersinia sp. 2540 StPb PI]|uniref:hypothetical protein n=1 Tax=Yersinia sp. 2540 StPb PI TaxID=3117406 RepID=UPI003FA434D5